MSIFYNEWDKYAAQWLRNLSNDGHIPHGDVCEKSITDLTPDDLDGYDQCHFFTGIGGWLLALRWAGLEGVSGIWTGSPPCQPFSVAGKKLGVKDERHLAPTWIELIRSKKPTIIFGEQVAGAIKHGWIDDLFHELEAEGYSCGAAVLPACSVGAPHIRKRLFFGAVRLSDPNSSRRQYEPRNRPSELQHEKAKPTERECRTGDTSSIIDDKTDSYNCLWSNVDWIGCRDGKFRPVEPGTQPLADGIPARVGRLRGYGNAIVPQVAAFFIEQFMGAIGDMLENE